MTLPVDTDSILRQNKQLLTQMPSFSVDGAARLPLPMMTSDWSQLRVEILMQLKKNFHMITL